MRARGGAARLDENDISLSIPEAENPFSSSLIMIYHSHRKFLGILWVFNLDSSSAPCLNAYV